MQRTQKQRRLYGRTMETRRHGPRLPGMRWEALRCGRAASNAVYASAGSQKQDFHSSIAHDSAVSTAFASRVSNANRVPAATCRKLQQNTHCQRGKRAMPSAESAGHVPRRLAAVGNAQYVSKSCRRTGLRPSNKDDRPGKMERKRATSAYKPQSLHLLQSEQPCDWPAAVRKCATKKSWRKSDVRSQRKCVSEARTGKRQKNQVRNALDRTAAPARTSTIN